MVVHTLALHFALRSVSLFWTAMLLRARGVFGLTTGPYVKMRRALECTRTRTLFPTALLQTTCKLY